MKLTLLEARVKRVQLSPTQVGSGASYQTAVMTISAPAGSWPTGAATASLGGAKLRCNTIKLVSPDDPVSVDFHGLDATGKTVKPGARQWGLTAARIRSASITRQKGGEPICSLQLYVKKGVKDLADWAALTPAWSGCIVLESVDKSLFDDHDPVDEPNDGTEG